MCGSYKGVLKSGLSCLGVDCVGACINTRTITTRIQENKTTCDTKTKDNVFVRIDVAVQMQVLPENTYDAVYRLTDPQTQVDSFVKDVIRGSVPAMTLDQAFEAKDTLATAVKERLSEAMAGFGYAILNSLVTDIDPDAAVKRAMNDIETSKRTRLAQETKALADKAVQIRAAEADAESKFLQGTGIARQRGAIIDGLRDSLGGADQISSAKVSELLLITQYFDTIKEVSQGRATTVFVPGSASTDSMSTQLRDGMMQARAATIPQQSRMS
jgi:regulator of protease activity HflC (stomatin/prohibitin superfamily)